MRISKVAIRYAKSLLDLAVERGALEGAQEDMTTVANTVGGSRELQLLLQSPIIVADKKLEILKLIFKDLLGPVSSNFVEIITRKGRESLLESIANAFIIMAKERKNIFQAEVITARPLDDETRQKLLAIVGQLQPGEIELTETINADIIGGFVLRIGDRMVDTSVLTEFRELRKAFADNPYISET